MTSNCTIVTAINSDWLAGWRQISERERQTEAVSRGNKQLISRNETLLSSSPTPSGKLKLRKL